MPLMDPVHVSVSHTLSDWEFRQNNSAERYKSCVRNLLEHLSSHLVKLFIKGQLFAKHVCWWTMDYVEEDANPFQGGKTYFLHLRIREAKSEELVVFLSSYAYDLSALLQSGNQKWNEVLDNFEAAPGICSGPTSIVRKTFSVFQVSPRVSLGSNQFNTDFLFRGFRRILEVLFCNQGKFFCLCFGFQYQLWTFSSLSNKNEYFRSVFYVCWGSPPSKGVMQSQVFFPQINRCNPQLVEQDLGEKELNSFRPFGVVLEPMASPVFRAPDEPKKDVIKVTLSDIRKLLDEEI